MNGRNLSALESLPAEIIKSELSSHIDKNAYTSLCLSSSTLYPQLLPQKLLMHAANDEHEIVKNILQNHPALIKHRGYVKDEAGYTHCGTVFQIAIRNLSMPLLNCMQPVFNELDEGHEEKIKQFNEVLPNGFNSNDSCYDFQPIINAITNDPLLNGEPNNDTQILVEEFKSHFNTKSDTATGLSFNLQNLTNAFQKFSENVTNWFAADLANMPDNQLESNKCNFFILNVLDPLACKMPASDVKFIEQFFNVTNSKKDPLAKGSSVFKWYWAQASDLSNTCFIPVLTQLIASKKIALDSIMGKHDVRNQKQPGAQ